MEIRDTCLSLLSTSTNLSPYMSVWFRAAQIRVNQATNQSACLLFDNRPWKPAISSYRSRPEFCHVPPGHERTWRGRRMDVLVGINGDTRADDGSPSMKVQKSCIDGGPTVSGCWLRWVCRGVGLGGLGGGPLAGSIQHGGRWGLLVVTLHLWQGGKQLPSLLEAHYSISPEGSHWGTLSLLLLSPSALSLCRSFVLLSSSERLNWSFFVFDQLFSHSQVSLELSGIHTLSSWVCVMIFKVRISPIQPVWVGLPNYQRPVFVTV